MRPYVANSPQAVARILALSMLIDGVADELEYRSIEENGSLLDLGISHAQIDTVIREFYEDLDLGVAMARTLDQRLTAADLSRLLGEISDPALQQGLLKAMLQTVVANDQLSAGEMRLLREALVQWTCDDGVGSFPLQAQVPCRRVADRLS